MSLKSNRRSKSSTVGSTVTNYNISISELQELVKREGEYGTDFLNPYGGIKGLCHILQTSEDDGLTESPKAIQHRRKYFGKNSIDPPKSKTYCQLVLIALNDPILIFLEVGGIFSILVAIFQRYYYESHLDDYDWIEGVAIIASVVIIVLVTATTDYQKEKQFRNLQLHLKSEHKIPVIRNGQLIDIPTQELVVGDICLIKYGNSVPADGIIIQSSDLKIDESALTGESDLVTKGIDHGLIVLSGTYVMEGNAKILITAVGIHSQNGIILALLGLHDEGANENNNTSVTKIPKVDVSKDKSILQMKLLQIAYNISKAAIIIAVILVLILLIEFIYLFIKNDETWNTKCIHNLIDYVLTGVSILVIAIPEGLPLAVTLSLAYSVKKMTYDNNLVRNLAACETMGNATIICSDKTGTLTTNRMTCVELYACEKLYKKIPKIERLPKLCGELIIEGLSVNSLYTSRLVTVKYDRVTQVQQIGNKTECALLGLVNAFNGNYELIRLQYPENNFAHTYTFNSMRKSMSTVIKLNNEEKNYRLYTKGASEMVMLKCRYIFDINGKVEEFTTEMKSNLNTKVIMPMANIGYRTITVAYRNFLSDQPVKQNEKHINNIEPDWNKEDEIVTDLTFLCLCGIQDPVRPEVPNAIRLCQAAGISVRMVTGDNIETAKSIALKCGIIKPDETYLIMEGPDFNSKVFDEDGNFNQKKFDRIWPRLRVLARSTPLDKYILVKGIIDSKITRHREIVAVTGDGTNDGPALKIADVGFAMGIAGTDVAKEASDIIITDDNFSSIVKAVMWGRNIYDSISKFIQFQLTVNLVAVTIACVTAVITNQSALKATHLLWVNLIMDSLASLALATEKPTEKILKRKPYGRTKSILSIQMMINIFLQAIYQLLVLAIILLYFHKLLDIPHGQDSTKPSEHYTMVFNSLVLMTLFNEINSRKLHGEMNIFEGLFSNYIFLIIWLLTLTIQITIVQVGGLVLHAKALTIEEWLWCIGFGTGTLLWSFIYNRLPIENCLKRIYYSFCHKNRRRDFENDNLDDDEILNNQWILASKRLTTQMDVIHRLSTRDDTDGIKRSSTASRQEN